MVYCSYVFFEATAMARQNLSPMIDMDITPPIAGGSPVHGMTHLKYLRKKNGYTLESLSKVTNISISYLSRLESGSRRLNTDLIRRLSHAFGCDPSELLQDNNRNDVKKSMGSVHLRSRNNGLLKPFPFTHQKTFDGPMKDVPVYCLSKETTDNGDKVMLLRTAPVEWRYRPVELAGKDAFAIKSGSYFKPYFSPTAIIYLAGNKNLVPENTVIITPENDNIMLKKVWSVTPTSLQVCNLDEIEGLKDGTISQSRLLTINNDQIKEIYKVIGFSDFDAA